MKPVAAGAEPIDGQLQNTDALALIASSSVKLDYATVNPITLSTPASPNIAAKREQRTIDLEAVTKAFTQCRGAADIVLVEGVGGWRVPLSAEFDTVDLARQLALPVILVCGLRLGCINHALLSAAAIVADGCQMLGWIANHCEPTYAYAEETVATLIPRMPAPLLAEIPWSATENLDMIATDLHPVCAQIWPDPP